MAQIFAKTGAITADTEWELDALNLSDTRMLPMRISVGIPTGVGSDTLDIYLCSRDQSGVWEDRVHSVQFLGNAASAYEKKYTLQSIQPLGDTEEAGDIPGPAQATRLAADSVRHGHFPGLFLSGSAPPATGWKIILDKGGAGTPSWAVTIRIDADEYDPGY